MKLKVSCRSSRILLALKLSSFGGGRNAVCTVSRLGVVIGEEVVVADGTGCALEKGAVVADEAVGTGTGGALVACVAVGDGAVGSARSSSSECGSGAIAGSKEAGPAASPGGRCRRAQMETAQARAVRQAREALQEARQ